MDSDETFPTEIDPATEERFGRLTVIFGLLFTIDKLLSDGIGTVQLCSQLLAPVMVRHNSSRRFYLRNRSGTPFSTTTQPQHQK